MASQRVYQSGDFKGALLLKVVLDPHQPTRSKRGMAHVRLHTTATPEAITRNLARFKAFLAGDIPPAVGGAVTVTLVNRTLIEGHAVLDALKQKYAVDTGNGIASRTGYDHGKFVQSSRFQLLEEGGYKSWF